MRTPATELRFDAVSALDRRSRFELLGEIRLDFPTHHPQGMAFAKGLTFLSSVEILEAPRPAADPALRTPGRGNGHVFVLGAGGELMRDIPIGEGAVYHPGGIDFDGDHVWVSVAEYRAAGRSIIYTIDPDTFEVAERFRVDDHIGWILRDPGLDLVFGGSWGSRRLYTWDSEGRLVDQWENPSHFVDYQDAQLLGPGLLLCSGISLLPQADGTALELGGLALVEPLRQRITWELPISVFSGAGHVITRNPVAVTADESGLLIHAAPDDGDDEGGTRILSYKSI
ncbi:DUF6454 family protein [Arthrobacter bambusae]|uniref:DUF6454 family protein n=1 Tax=Arthrobacter bambusae TaxID=1338426 RepID=UPI002786EB5F|nr:DUF6454 family protein [Arthrobacter bambusae]MDQ0029413.1 hypothetical protein [Arthrobacter bambusae]MDQ0097073.1 hypothetical protein [Arthrobacter bambusae]